MAFKMWFADSKRVTIKVVLVLTQLTLCILAFAITAFTELVFLTKINMLNKMRVII